MKYFVSIILSISVFTPIWGQSSYFAMGASPLVPGRGINLSIPYTSCFLMQYGYNGTGSFGFSSEISSVSYGSLTLRRPYSGRGYPHSDADISVRSSLLFWNNSLIYEPYTNEPISPFVEAGIGWAFFTTRWTADNPYHKPTNCDESSIIESAIIHHDNVFHVQFGIGSRVRLLHDRESGTSIGLLIGVKWMLGGEVEHLNPVFNEHHFLDRPLTITSSRFNKDKRPYVANSRFIAFNLAIYCRFGN